METMDVLTSSIWEIQQQMIPSGERTVNYICTSDLGWPRYGDHKLTRSI